MKDKKINEKIIRTINIKNEGITVFILKLISFKSKYRTKYYITEDYFKGEFRSKDLSLKSLALRKLTEKANYLKGLIK